MMALMMRNAIYSFDRCLIASFCVIALRAFRFAEVRQG
jgi:hypothetical protein